MRSCLKKSRKKSGPFAKSSAKNKHEETLLLLLQSREGSY